MRFEFIRFLIVGVANTLVGLSVMFILLHGAGFSYWAATFIGNSVGAIVSFFLNRSFTFKNNGAFFGSMVRFIAVILLCYVVSYNLGSYLIEQAAREIHIIPTKILTDIKVVFSTGLYTVLNYLLQKLFVFSAKGRQKASSAT